MKKPFSITVEQDLYDFAQQQASTEGRTMSNYIENLIRRDKEAKKEKEDR